MTFWRIRFAASSDVIHPETGEVLVQAGKTIFPDVAKAIEDAGVNVVTLSVDGHDVKVIGNNFVDAAAFLPFDPAEVGINEKVHLTTLKEIMEDANRLLEL